VVVPFGGGLGLKEEKILRPPEICAIMKKKRYVGLRPPSKMAMARRGWLAADFGGVSFQGESFYAGKPEKTPSSNPGLF
jgi:hypothetical protein